LNLTSKVGPVRNQNGCNSCWAFSTDYITEYVARKRSSSSKLVGAPQQLLDCCTTCGSCNGGRVKASLDYLKSAGVANESVYPYQGVVGSCSYNNLTQKAGFINTTGIVFLYGNETKLR
jgi:C1A family cysteine protease